MRHLWLFMVIFVAPQAKKYILCVKFMFRAPSGSSRRSPCSRAATDDALARAKPPLAAGTDARLGRHDRGTCERLMVLC